MITNDIYYSDFLIDMNPHPVVGDVVKYTNENAVNASIRNLLLTDRGERLYQPNIGSDIKRMLFEPIAESTAELISTLINNTLKNHEPRAQVVSVNVEPYEDKNLYIVTITYYVINSQNPVSLNITLNRVR